MAAGRLSVEISSSAVRMAEVAVGRGQPELVRIGQVALPPRAVLDGVILDFAAVRVALERCIKEGGFSAGDVHLGIVGLRAITRELGMPLLPDSEIDSAVRLQALDVIPFAIDRALISARPLEETVGPNGLPERRVLVAAAHRDLVDPLVQIVTAAGLTPVSVEPTSSAMIRALFDPATALDGPEAIIAIGAGLTNVAVHENGVPHFVRTIAEGGDAVTAAIASVLGLPVADAEVVKRNLDEAAPHARVALATAREASMSLIAELRSSIDYYGTLTGRNPVRRVVVTGGGSCLSGFVEQLQQQLRLPVVQGARSAGSTAHDSTCPLEEIARLDSAVAVVVGLALPGSKDVKELDLLPPEVLLGRQRKQLERSIILVGVVLVVAMAGLGVLRFLKVHNAENQVAGLQRQIAYIRTQIPKYDKVQQDTPDPRPRDDQHSDRHRRSLLARRDRGPHALPHRQAARSPASPPARFPRGSGCSDSRCSCTAAAHAGRDADRDREHLSPIADRVHLLPQLVLLRQRIRQADRQRLQRDFASCRQAGHFQCDGGSNRRRRFNPGQRVQGAMMDRVPSADLDLLKSKVVLIVTGCVIVLLIVWWFAWMTPEASKLTTVQQQVTTDSAK